MSTVSLSDLRLHAERVAFTLDALADRIGAAAQGYADTFCRHATNESADRAALARDLHREAIAGVSTLLEVAHLSGELLGLSYAVGRLESDKDAAELIEDMKAKAEGETSP